MRRQIDERQCDECGKSQANATGRMVGCSPWGGWITVEITDGLTMLPRPHNGPWDFCSVDCAVKFLEGKSCE